MTSLASEHRAQNYSRRYLSDVLQWDISTWKRALVHWDTVLAEWESSGRDLNDMKALDIGARNGGLSLYLAMKGMQVICSDLGGPSEKARELHQQYHVDDRVTYRDIDATAIPLESKSLDVVIFKSVLGGVAEYLGAPAIKTALAEIHRVLKPGGLLLYAENQEATGFHQWARRRFVSWGSTWYYVPHAEFAELLSPFAGFETKTYGFFSCMKKDFLPTTLLDRIICLSKCSPSHYMAYGHATK